MSSSSISLSGHRSVTNPWPSSGSSRSCAWKGQANREAGSNAGEIVQPGGWTRKQAGRRGEAGHAVTVQCKEADRNVACGQHVASASVLRSLSSLHWRANQQRGAPRATGSNAWLGEQKRQQGMHTVRSAGLWPLPCPPLWH